MDADVVEVVTRFGGTILDVTHVGPTDTYRIGTAPGTHCSVPGLVCFPLVDGGTIRRPLGIATVEHDGWTELRVGELALWISRTRLRRAPLARPRFDWRPVVFVAASLVAHLAVWLVALTYAPLERLGDKPRLRMVAIQPSQPPPIEAQPKPPPRMQEPAADVQPKQRQRVERTLSPREEQFARAKEKFGRSASYWVARAAKSFDDTHVVEKLGALTEEGQYYEDDEYAGGFGTGRSFDPSKREGFESVKSGAYATMVHDVKLCPNKDCSVEGPVPPLYVRTHLLHHMDAIYECYAQHASGPGTIVLTFTIDSHGGVYDAHGSGLGETGACAARVVGEIFFKALGDDWDPPRETHVRWPVQFKS